MDYCTSVSIAAATARSIKMPEGLLGAGLPASSTWCVATGTLLFSVLRMASRLNHGPVNSILGHAESAR